MMLNSMLLSFAAVALALASSPSTARAADGDAKAKADAKTEAKAETKKENTPAKTAVKGEKVATKNPVVTMETSLGNVDIELYQDKAPITVENFLKYTDSGFYNGTIFHRVIDGFMIQGGGFEENMQQKPTQAQIKNEATNGLKNEKGTLAMARTNIVDSATAQFFINVKDNEFLNHVNKDQFGYAVFGKVVGGMDVVDKIRAVPTTFKGGHENVPSTPVVIKGMKRKS